MKQSIYNVYDKMTPDSAAKERMLLNILSAAADIPSPVENERKTTMKHKKILIIAAAAAVLLSLSVAAYATGFFGLNDIKMDSPSPIGGDAYVPDDYPFNADFISLQGLSDTPEYKACAEYEEFLSGYDTDGSILDSIGNSPTEFDGKYSAYICYTQEMADKIDEICEKYSLILTENLVSPDSSDELFSTIGISGIYALNSPAAISTYCGYCYDNGTFQLEGNTVIPPEYGFLEPIEYQFRCCRRGAFDTVILNIGNTDDYEQWQYTNASGDTMLLALSEEKAVILANLPDSFITVNILNTYYGDITEGEVHLSREGLQAFADSFDLSELR